MPRQYRKTPVKKYVRIFGISVGAGTYFRGPYLLSMVWQDGVKNSARKESVQSNAFRRQHVVHVSAIMHILPGYRRTYTAWDSEIELLTSLDASLIELDRRKTRRRHRVTAALAPSKSCLLPCNANLHASSASLKRSSPSPSFFEWSSFLAHRLVVVTHAIVKIRCKKETMESWQQSTRKGPHAFVSIFLSFIFPLLWFVLRRSKCGMAAVGRGHNELERRGVIKTLLDAGVESTRELS